MRMSGNFRANRSEYIETLINTFIGILDLVQYLQGLVFHAKSL
jgi:hypothetical protein